MMRSMYSGISGLRAFQTKMDVIGNNIANVNTVGFKSSRVTFGEVLNQTIQPAYGSTTDGMGGANAQQVGLGVAVGSIDISQNAAGVQNTNGTYDLAIDGDGYFEVTDGTNKFYTRAGNFHLDDAGNLVTAGGYKVCNKDSTPITIDPSSGYTKVSIAANGDITGTNSSGDASTIATIGLAVFPNPQGLMKSGNNLYSATNGSGTVKVDVPGSSNEFSSLMPGYLEMSNVDLAQEFTDMIIAQRGFQANSKVITTSDSMLQDLTQIIR